VYDKAETHGLVLVAELDNPVEWVDDTLLRGADDGDDGVDGLLFVQPFLEERVEFGDIDAGEVVY
jgi:hypothetical protein